MVDHAGNVIRFCGHHLAFETQGWQVEEDQSAEEGVGEKQDRFAGAGKGRRVKRAIRSRMERTGETFGAARLAVLDGKT
jgi:hypothetical protein